MKAGIAEKVKLYISFRAFMEILYKRDGLASRPQFIKGFLLSQFFKSRVRKNSFHRIGVQLFGPFKILDRRLRVAAFVYALARRM